MTVWAVGPFRSSDPRGLVEKVRALNHERTDYELLSLIADAPDLEFQQRCGRSSRILRKVSD